MNNVIKTIWNKAKYRYIDQSICFIGDAFWIHLYALSSHFSFCKNFVLQSYFLQISLKLT